MTWFSKIMALCILFSILYLILPDGGTKRTVGTMMTIVLALQVLSPLFSFDFNKMTAWFLSIQEGELIDQSDSDDLTRIFDTYESKCIEEIQSHIEKENDVKSCDVKVVINRDPDSERVGFIEHIYLYVSYGTKENNNFIKPIEIFPSDRWEDKNIFAERNSELKKDISSWLSVDNQCITVFNKEDSYA